jgi:hypothetical protein
LPASRSCRCRAVFALDRDPDLPTTVNVEAPVDRLHETTLTRQQLHFLADENALRDRQRLQKRYDAIGT